MNKLIVLKGKIERGYEGDYEQIYLVQKNGYKINIIHRLNEAIINYGTKMTIKYWYADKFVSEKIIKLNVIKKFYGILTAEYETQDWGHSEYTHGTDYNTIINIGGHNLYNELLSLQNKFIWIEIIFN